MNQRNKLLAVIALIAMGVATYMWWPSQRGRHFRIAKKALALAERYELLSLDPRLGSGLINPSQFHGYHILGQTTVTDPAHRRRLIDALAAGVDQADPDRMKACFNPRHGIQVKSGQQVVDLVICFECSYFQVWVDGQMLGIVTTTESPQPVFDDVLQRANVPLAQKSQ